MSSQPPFKPSTHFPIYQSGMRIGELERYAFVSDGVIFQDRDPFHLTRIGDIISDGIKPRGFRK